MGELKSNIFIIGSPDVDLILNSDLPDIEHVKLRYQISYKRYAIALFTQIQKKIII